MSRSDEQRVADILDACDELMVVKALKDGGSAPERVLRRAAERLLEIIGEAATNVSDAGRRDHPGVDWRAIARLRVLLAHHYHRTDPDLVWMYVGEQVPALAEALRP